MHLPELTDIHEQFLALSQIAREQFRESLGGRSLLRSQFDGDGIAAVVAASIAGAASLCVDSDADRLREGLRGGFVDFVVSQLDEALRILKNEIRRGRAISVGVTADPLSCIDAIIERGLQPDLLSGVPQSQAAILHKRGATTPAHAIKQVSELAHSALDPQRADTTARVRWLAQSPRYLGRTFAVRQCLRMTPREIANLLPRMHAEFPAARITRNGEVV